MEKYHVFYYLTNDIYVSNACLGGLDLQSVDIGNENVKNLVTFGFVNSHIKYNRMGSFIDCESSKLE